MTSLLQARFLCKDDRYKVSDVPFALPTTATSIELNAVINTLLDQQTSVESTSKSRPIDFDFLVDGEFLQTSLNDHVEAKDLSTETVLEIEYVVKSAPPQPKISVPHDDWVSSVACASDMILSGSFDGTARVLDKEGNCLAKLCGHDEAVKTVAWVTSDDSELCIVTGSQDQEIRLWKLDCESGEGSCQCVLKGHLQGVESLASSESTQMLCSGSWDGTIKIWQTKHSTTPTPTPPQPKFKKGLGGRKRKLQPEPLTKNCLVTLSGHKQAVSSVLWLNSDSICSAGWDHCIRLWDAESGVNTFTLTGTTVFRDVDYSPSSRLLASGGSDRHVRLWDPRSGDENIVKMTLTAHAGWVSSVAWSPRREHQLVSASYDTTIRHWDTRSPKKPLLLLREHSAKVFSIDWSISEVIASGGADSRVIVHRT
ncbi:ribosome biogenesis protein wdr12-like [Oscarella lobularis]|uniref:ribosome biogenesis protein wdr12-like n=1 Tax=Oscarella lobularis TaxID=121494 RepID=UPI003313704A